MPTKLGKGGSGMEDFDPETGEYSAGASISKRGNKYWVHGDLRSREISKEEYDLYKSKGYKEDFDNGNKKQFKLVHTRIGTYLRPSNYEQDWYRDIKVEDVEFDEDDVMDLLNDESLSERELRQKLGQLVHPDYGNTYEEGDAILRMYKKQYDEIKKQRREAKFKPKAEKADKYLNDIGKKSDWDSKTAQQKIISSNFTANVDNYKLSKSQISNRKLYDMYTSNCQRCVMAWYLNMLGYDVEAMPYDGDDYYNQFGKAKSNRILYQNEPRIGYDFEGGTAYRSNWSFSGFNIPEDTKYDYHGKDGEHQKTQFKNIAKQVSESPDGSVYFCSVKWRGYRSAHVFIIYNDGGKPKFIDPQNNSDASRFFDKNEGYSIVAAETSLLRVNDFSLNGDVLPEIVRKKGEGKKQYDEYIADNYKSI